MTVQVVRRSGPFDEGAFGAAWADERERQFAEEVPRMREVDLEARVVRVLARMRGMAPPAARRRWDDAAAARLSSRDEVEAALDDYSAAFVARIPPSAGDRAAARPARRRATSSGSARTGRSRSRSTATSRRPAGPTHLSAIVVSQRVGADQARPEASSGRPRPRSAPRPRGSSTSATTGRRMSSERGGPAGASPGSASRPDDSPLPGQRADRRPRARPRPRPAGRPGGRARDAPLNRPA